MVKRFTELRQPGVQVVVERYQPAVVESLRPDVGAQDRAGRRAKRVGVLSLGQLTPVGQNVFKQVEGGLQIDSGDTLAFRENQAGEVTYGMVSLQNTAFERLAWYESAAAQFGTMVALLLLFLSAVVVRPLGAVLRRLRMRHHKPDPSWRRAVRVSWAVSALNLVFLLVVLLSFGEELVFGVPLLIRAILVIPIVTSVLSLALLALTAVAWGRGHGTFVGRLYTSLIALASVLFVLFAGYWNMLGWRF